MSGFFSPNNWYWKPFAYVADAVILSGLWLICCLPIFTAGAATTALYDCVAHCVRGPEKDVFGRFFRTLRQELVPSLITSLIWGVILGGGYQLIQVFAGTLQANNASVMLVAGLLFLLCILLGIFSWVLPLLSRFTFPVAALNLTAIRLACGHPFRTVLLGILTAAAVALCLRTWFSFLIAPEVLLVFWAMLMEPVFKKYMTKEELEALQKPSEDQDDLL